MAIFREQLQLIRSPEAAIAELESNPRAAFVGLRHVLVLALLYELAILLWALGGATPTMPAFLRIPDESYYYYQLIFMIPMILVTWLLASAVAYVLARALGGSGCCDTILGGFGIAALFSTYFALIPDFIQGVLWTTGWVAFAEYQDATSRGLLAALVWGYILAYNLSYLILYAITIRYSQNIGMIRSAFVAAVSFFSSVSLFITIVR